MDVVYDTTIGNGNIYTGGNIDVSGNLTVTGTTSAKVPGPYANDGAAASGGVKVGEMYYQASGVVYVRLT
jgi:hypothetical protein